MHTTSGIRFRLERTGGKTLRRDLYRHRRGLFHGFEPISEVVKDIETPLRQGLDALRDAVLDVLNIPEDIWKAFQRSTMRIPKTPRVRAEYVLLGAQLDAVPLGSTYPHLEFSKVKLDREEEEVGRRREHGAVELRLVGYQGLLRHRALEVEADRDPDDPEAKIEITVRE